MQLYNLTTFTTLRTWKQITYAFDRTIFRLRNIKNSSVTTAMQRFFKFLKRKISSVNLRSLFIAKSLTTFPL